jgi:glycosyltransferase involved in cell wall biosynthesis
MLTKDRPAMAARAVRSFQAQTYPHTFLVVYDNGEKAADLWSILKTSKGDLIHAYDPPAGFSIGKLRNEAIKLCPQAEIVCHFDDDDYSHPNRIAEQVALLQSSGAACVGYSQAVFWDTVTSPVGVAWVYSGAPIGASFCYWRKTWEDLPFEDVSRGEDDRFWRALRVAGKKVLTVSGVDEEPRMIHHIHGGNTWTPDYAKAVAHGSNNWRRALGCAAYCRERMKL